MKTRELRMLFALLFATIALHAASAQSLGSVQKPAPGKLKTAQQKESQYEGTIKGSPSTTAFVLSTTRGPIRVDAMRASILVDGRAAQLSSLKNGMRAIVKGKLLGAMLIAKQVSAKSKSKP